MVVCLLIYVGVDDGGFVYVHLCGDAEDDIVAVKVVAAAVVFHTHPHGVGAFFNETAEIALRIDDVQVFCRITCSLEIIAFGVGRHSLQKETIVLFGRIHHFPTVVETNAHALGQIDGKGRTAYGRYIAVCASRIAFENLHYIIGVIVLAGHRGRFAGIDVVHVKVGIVPFPHFQAIAGSGCRVHLILYFGQVVYVVVNLRFGQVNVLNVVVGACRVIIIAQHVGRCGEAVARNHGNFKWAVRFKFVVTVQTKHLLGIHTFLHHFAYHVFAVGHLFRT